MGLSLDQTTRVFLPLAYVLIIINAILFFAGWYICFCVLIISGGISLPLLSIRLYRSRLKSKQKLRRRTLERLANVNPNAPESRALLEEGFNTFDIDGSGEPTLTYSGSVAYPG